MFSTTYLIPPDLKKIFVIFATLLVACSSTPQTEIELFNNIAFELRGNEQVVELSEPIQHDYFWCVEPRGVQIPLFRCVKTPDYTIYIGLPFNTSIKECLAATGLPPDVVAASVRCTTDSTSYIFREFQTQKSTNSEYITLIDNNLVYLLTETTTAQLADPLFSYKELSSRFIVKK